MEGLCVKGLGAGVSESWVNRLISLFEVFALAEGVLGLLVVIFIVIIDEKEVRDFVLSVGV